MGLVYSILKEYSLKIDSFADLTIDKAQFGGHYYPDKAPGLSFMALPVVSLVLPALRTMHMETRPVIGRIFTTSYYVTGWLACVVTSSLFTAFAAATLYLLARHCRASKSAGLFGALVFGLAMPSAGWATVFFSHATAGACLFVAFALMILVSEASSEGRRDFTAGLVIGALLSLSVVVELTAAAAALGLGCFAIYRLLDYQPTALRSWPLVR
jgi:hypothetical protein